MRIRTVKPEFFKDDDLFDLEQDHGLPFRVAFAGLWGCCDREGRFVWKPRPLKSDILPYDEVDFGSILDILEEHGFIVSYEAGGKKYGWVRTFSKHQRVRRDEAQSLLPPCPEEESSPTRDEPVTNPSRTRNGDVTKQSRGKEGEGNRKGNGKEGKGGREAPGKCTSGQTRESCNPLPPPSPPTSGQMTMLEDMARERGRALETEAKAAGLTWPLGRSEVTPMRRHLAGLDQLSEKELRDQARKAVLDQLWESLRPQLRDPLATAARIREVRGQDEGHGWAMLMRLNTWLNDQAEAEDHGRPFSLAWPDLDRLPELYARTSLPLTTHHPNPPEGECSPDQGDHLSSDPPGSPRASAATSARQLQAQSNSTHNRRQSPANVPVFPGGLQS